MTDKDDDLVRSVNGSIVMIARKKGLMLLNTQRLDLCADGTFKYSPLVFKQMYTFIVFKDGYYLPVAHFLLVNKNAATYKRVLQMLSAECEKLGFSLSASLKDGSVMLVYEIAMINTFKSSFPSCKIKGCRLHIGQSWWCRIQRLGLAPLYR